MIRHTQKDAFDHVLLLIPDRGIRTRTGSHRPVMFFRVIRGDDHGHGFEIGPHISSKEHVH